MTEIKPGQTMLLATRRPYHATWTFEEITITKVGFVYGHFAPDRRFHIDTGLVNGLGDQEVFADRASFDAEQKRRLVWNRFRDRLSRLIGQPPRHITTHMIERAAAALEIEL